VRRQIRDHDSRQYEGQHRRRDAPPTHYANDQLLDQRNGTTVTSDYRNGRARCGSAIAARPDGPEDAKQAAWGQRKRGVFLVVSSRPAANVIDTADKIKAMLRGWWPRFQPAIQDRDHQAIATRHSRSGRGSSVHLLLTIALAFVMVIFRIPAQLLGSVIQPLTVRSARSAPAP